MLRYVPLRSLLFLLFLVTATQSLRAEFSADTVRDTLNAGDFAQLEQGFAQAHAAALKSRDFTALRAVYATLFVTANQDRLARTKAWVAAHPASPYAATALAWSHIHRGFAFRSTATRRHVPPEAMAAYEDEMHSARQMTDLALRETVNFLPALDAKLNLQMVGFDTDAVDPVVEQSLGIAPSRQSIRLGLSALTLNLGGSVEENVTLCARLAEQAPDYDAELCLIEFVFRNRLRGPTRDAAIAALATRDEPFLDYARLQVYSREWREKDGALDESRRILREMIWPEMSIQAYIDAVAYLPGLGIRSGAELLAIEREMIPALEARLADSPEDVEILLYLTRDRMVRVHEGGGTRLEEVDRAEAYLDPLMVIGGFRAETWSLMGRMLDARKPGGSDPVARLPYFGNQIHFSNYSADELGVFLRYLHQNYEVAMGVQPSPLEEAELFDMEAALRCPLVQVERLIDLYCGAHPEEAACSELTQGGVDVRATVRVLTGGGALCPEMRDGPLEVLLFPPQTLAEIRAAR